MTEHIAPPNTRPYRLASAPGDELTFDGYGNRHTFRQIGWHGQSGALYALGEDPSAHEPGSFSPLWLCVGVETVEEPEEPNLDMDLEEIRNGAAALGRIAGRAEAAAQIHRRAYYDAAHAELTWAGLCNCDDDEPEEKAPLTPDEVNQRIKDAFSQLSKATQAWLRPNPRRPSDPGEKPLADWERDLLAEAGRAAEANQDSDGEPDTVKFHASDYADKLTFDATPSWLTAALESGVVTGVFKGEDYWYLEVKTPAGVVTAEPGDTIHRHFDGGLLVRSPEGLCKKIERQDLDHDASPPDDDEQ